MNWGNVKLIFIRELRDQLRDRRTIFTVAVLPILLYPLLGMSFFQVLQFMKQHPSRVLVMGVESLPPSPPLIEYEKPGAPRIPLELFDSADEQKLIQLEVRPLPNGPVAFAAAKRIARAEIDAEAFDLVMVFPPDFAEQLAKARQAAVAGVKAAVTFPQPYLCYNTAKEKSDFAERRISKVFERWSESRRNESLIAQDVAPESVRLLQVQRADVAKPEQRKARLWSKILPFVLLIWALTGAFYPAVDLCAGEKERGTLETLLSSPAGRKEIVGGKLLAIMVFSSVTSLLNLTSMGVTGSLIASRLADLGDEGPFALGPPSLAAMAWLLLAVVPISAMFSAAALAVAALARSSKEGQYYLMPLLMICMPLMIIPLLPAAEIDLGGALIPVTGMMLLLRTLMEGRYAEALLYALPVLGVTAGCCWMCVRWAVDQFNNESVLFRESEQFDMRSWLKSVLRDRKDTPTVSLALMCGVLLLIIHFFANLMSEPPTSWQGFVTSTLVSQLAFIATPALLMTIMLTRNPVATLSLRPPRPIALLAVAGLAIAVHPVAMILKQAVLTLYEPNDAMAETLTQMSRLIEQAPLGWLLLAFAVMPALCEELAFRGFILSGLRHSGHKWGAIITTAALFGVIHGMLQQSLIAAALGVILGFVAVQTGSIVACMVFHIMHNSLMLLVTRYLPQRQDEWWANRVARFEPGGEFHYQVWVVAAGGLATILILMYLRQLPWKLTEEEGRQRALESQARQYHAA